jgi:hypothetical protein
MSSKTDSDKDVDVFAVPSENLAKVIANSAEAMVVTKSFCGTVTNPIVKVDKINDFLNSLRDKNLSFSFKLSK